MKLPGKLKYNDLRALTKGIDLDNLDVSLAKLQPSAKQVAVAAAAPSPKSAVLPPNIRRSVLLVRQAVDEGVESYRKQGPKPSTIGGVPEREIPTGFRAKMGDIDDVKLEMEMELLAEGKGVVASEMRKRGVTLTSQIQGEVDAAQEALRRLGPRDPSRAESKREYTLLFDAIARRHGGKSIVDIEDIVGDVGAGGRFGDRIRVDWDAMGKPEEGVAASLDVDMAMDELESALYGSKKPPVAQADYSWPAAAEAAAARRVR